MGILEFNNKLGKEEANISATEVRIGEGRAPKYAIRCAEMFSSEMTGMEDCAPCDWVKTGGARTASFDSSGKLNGDARIIGKDPVVQMDYGPWAPVLQEFMYTGNKIEEIDIYRLTDINGEIVQIQQLKYSTCMVKTYDQEGDKILFSFCFVTLEDLQMSYKQDGTKIGQVGMQFDFTTLAVKSTS